MEIFYIILLVILIIIGIMSLNTTLCIIMLLNDLRKEKGLKPISMNPIEKITEIKEKVQENKELEDYKKRQELESEALATMLDNIEKYDGTGTGQQDVPDIR